MRLTLNPDWICGLACCYSLMSLQKPMILSHCIKYKNQFENKPVYHGSLRNFHLTSSGTPLPSKICGYLFHNHRLSLFLNFKSGSETNQPNKSTKVTPISRNFQKTVGRQRTMYDGFPWASYLLRVFSTFLFVLILKDPFFLFFVSNFFASADVEFPATQ